MKLQLKNKKNKNLLLHVLVWTVLFLLPFIFSGNRDSVQHKEHYNRIEFQLFDEITTIFWIVIFYFNANILTPKLMDKRKYIFYFLSLIALFIVTIWIHTILFYWMYYPNKIHFVGASMHKIIPYLFTITISTTYKVISDKIKLQNLQKEKQSENLKTELSFLRSQISPHFLFNVLNNIVAMVRLKSEELEPTIIKLSSLLQYMLYESGDEKVLLKNEIESLQNYFDLQKLRLNKNVKLQIHFDVKEDWHSIEPMLLIPFVENAFKHNNGVINNSEISIELNVLNNNLFFKVKNNYMQNNGAKDKISGIGLANVKRRLDLLYPNTHRLQIDNLNGWYEVYLKLVLQ